MNLAVSVCILIDMFPDTAIAPLYTVLEKQSHLCLQIFLFCRTAYNSEISEQPKGLPIGHVDMENMERYGKFSKTHIYRMTA